MLRYLFEISKSHSTQEEQTKGQLIVFSLQKHCIYPHHSMICSTFWRSAESYRDKQQKNTLPQQEWCFHTMQFIVYCNPMVNAMYKMTQRNNQSEWYSTGNAWILESISSVMLCGSSFIIKMMMIVVMNI